MLAGPESRGIATSRGLSGVTSAGSFTPDSSRTFSPPPIARVTANSNGWTTVGSSYSSRGSEASGLMARDAAGRLATRASAAASFGCGSIRTPSVSIAPRPASSRCAGSGRAVVRVTCRVRQSSIRFAAPPPMCRVWTRSISRSSVPRSPMPRV